MIDDPWDLPEYEGEANDSDFATPHVEEQKIRRKKHIMLILMLILTITVGWIYIDGVMK